MSEQKIPSIQELIKIFAQVNNISEEEAKEQLSAAETPEQMLELIKNINLEKIYSQTPQLNRAQRRALAKKKDRSGRNQLEIITETAKKMNYINLIQKLRELNQKEAFINENSTENS